MQMEEPGCIKDRLRSNSKTDMASSTKGLTPKHAQKGLEELDEMPKTNEEIWKLLVELRKTINNLSIDVGIAKGMEPR